MRCFRPVYLLPYFHHPCADGLTGMECCVATSADVPYLILRRTNDEAEEVDSVHAIA